MLTAPRRALQPSERPRLLFRGQSLAALRDKVKDPAAGRLYALTLANAERFLAQPIIVPPSSPSTAMDRSPGELGLARRAQRIILTLAVGHLLTGRDNYRERAWAEIECWLDRWDSWTDPYHGTKDHFDLMAGEMGLTMGLAYDWLKEELGEERRAKLREAITRRIISLYLVQTDPPKPVWWYKAYHNWNTVCNGGAVVAALSLEGEDPRTAEVIARAEASWGGFYDALGTEGGWDEGTGYWQYGMRYAVMALAALQERGKDDGGHLDRPGTRATAYFPISFCPGGIAVSWGDSGSSVRDPIFPLLGAIYRNPDFVAHFDRLAEDFKVADGGWPVEALGFLWRPVGEAWLPKPGAPLSIGTARVYREIGWSVFTDDWVKPSFVAGFKCGDLGANHTQLDDNVFQLWARGEWLAQDLGGGTYNKDYFSEKRWGMYVVSTAGHNALLIGGKGQLPKTKGTLVEVRNTPELAAVVGDASACYGDGEAWRAVNDVTAAGRAPARHGPGVARARRHFAVVRRAFCVVVDEVETVAPAACEWRLHAPRGIEAAGNRAVVRGERTDLHVVFPPGAAELSLAEDPGELPAGRKLKDFVLSAATPAATSLLLPAVLVPVPAGGAAPEVSFERDERVLTVRVRRAGEPEAALTWTRSDSGWSL